MNDQKPFEIGDMPMNSVVETIEASPAQLIEMKIDQLERHNKELLRIIEQTIRGDRTELAIMQRSYIDVLESVAKWHFKDREERDREIREHGY